VVPAVPVVVLVALRQRLVDQRPEDPAERLAAAGVIAHEVSMAPDSSANRPLEKWQQTADESVSGRVRRQCG
jgi:hypothetical protein